MLVVVLEAPRRGQGAVRQGAAALRSAGKDDTARKDGASGLRGHIGWSSAGPWFLGALPWC